MLRGLAHVWHALDRGRTGADDRYTLVGELGPIQRTVRHDHVTRAQPVVAIGGDDPSAFAFVPPEFLDLGLEQRAAVKVELLCDALRVLQNFRREGILLLRNVAGLLEQRQIDVGLDIALRARIAVPVPGAAEVAAFLDDADVLEAGLAQPYSGQ